MARVTANPIGELSCLRRLGDREESLGPPFPRVESHLFIPTAQHLSAPGKLIISHLCIVQPCRPPLHACLLHSHSSGLPIP